MFSIGIQRKPTWFEMKLYCNGTTINADLSKDEIIDTIRELLPSLSLIEMRELLEEYHGERNVKNEFAESEGDNE